MEFEGRIQKVLPVRSGTSQRGEWKALPFVFEYFEHETDRYSDSVVLETFDTKVIENLKEGMKVKCGFSHRIREYEGKVYNELRLYKIESVRNTHQPSPQPRQAPFYAQTAPENTNGEEVDDLPF